MISTAWAESAGGLGASSAIMGWLPILLIFGVFYFLVLRPQSKRAQEHREMVNALRRGDKIMTNGGFYAEVSKIIDDDKVMLRIADSTEVEFHRGSIAQVVEKGQPAKASKAGKAATKKKAKSKK